MYQMAFESQRLGRASAVSYVLFALVLIVTLVQLRVMRRGGVWESDVPAAAAHATYVDAMLERAATDPGAPFVPHDPAERAPRPGDLLCADRARSPLLHWQDRLAEVGRFRPMHCDVVVSNRAGVVEAVGGNVLDSVALRRFPADRQGRVLPPPYDKAPFFVVFENRMR